MNGLFSVKKKVIIITGGGRGIGFHVGENMAKRGAFVYCVDTQFPKKISKNISNNLAQLKCNVTNKPKFQKICDKIFSTHKKIDVLINNAGVTFPEKGTKFYPEKKWKDTLSVNLTAAFNCSQAVLKYMMKKKYGSIINITSINAELGFPNNPAYVASKGGLKMLGKALARDWGKYGIRVNNVGPGYIKTEMTNKNYSNKKIRKSRQMRTMLGRWGELDDLIGPCVFLSSDASKYITGQDIYVDGGWLTNGLANE